MIAEVIPIKRLPRRFTHFDYTVPDELAEVIQTGQLVRIPLKSSEIFGLILSLRETTISNTNIQKSASPMLKEITAIVHETPILSEMQLQTLQTVSSWYGVAPGTLAKMMLLPLQKRKLKSIELRSVDHMRDSTSSLLTQEENKGRYSQDQHSLQTVPYTSKTDPLRADTREEPAKISFSLYTNTTAHQQLLKKQITKLPNCQIAIFVPEIHQIDEVLSLLSEHSEDVTTWHSGLSTKEQFERWLQIRNGEKRIIVGTRGAILLPYFNLGHIIIDSEHKDNHKHWDQAPRFHVKDVAELLRTSQGVDVTFMSYSPSVETYFHLHKHNYTTRHSDRLNGVEESRDPSEIFRFASLTRDDVHVADLSNERRGGNFSPISTKLEETLLHLKGNAFLHINRLGLATYIGCNDCGWRAICPSCQLPQILHSKHKQLTCHYCKTTNNLPVVCPECTASIVTLGGVGTETVETYVKELVTSNTLPHEVIRLDSQTHYPTSTLSNRHILIGTDAALPHIQWSSTDLVALLDIDSQLAIPEFRAQEELWHFIQEINYCKKLEALFFIQTRDPKHLVLRSLTEPDRFYRTDLNQRMQLGYPPYKYLVRYVYGHAQYLEAKKVMETSVEVLANRLKESQKDITLSPAFEMHPRYYRGRHWFAVLARLNPDTWQDDLIWLNAHIPGTWNIDPNPMSVLSP